jgi:hypothetical protein
MATTKFPKFSQGLANDPTRRIWFGIAKLMILKVMTNTG